MRFVYFFILVLLISCKSATYPESEKMAIARILFYQQAAWNEGDITEYMQGYHQSDSLRFASGGNVSYGWQTTLDRYKAGYPDKATMGQLSFSDIDINIISDESALVFGKWELERNDDHPWGLFSLLFKKTDQGWRIVHDHTSSAKE